MLSLSGITVGTKNLETALQVLKIGILSSPGPMWAVPWKKNTLLDTCGQSPV